MGCWRGKTFKEYVLEQVSSFLEVMSKSMGTLFGFVNVEEGVWSNITAATITLA